MKELETQERAALLLKVQRALDAAGINRNNFATFQELDVHPCDDLAFGDDGDFNGANILRKGSVEGTIELVNLDAEIMLGQGVDATFTFAELFPELEWYEWQDGIASEFGKVGFTMHDPTKGWLYVEKGGSDCWLDFRTPERAKRAAQSIADLLAEAGRES